MVAKKVYLERPSDEEAQQHRAKKEKQHAARAKILATKTSRKGLFMVMTGTGKGKTTAAMGLVLRALGHAKKVAIVQFVKGIWHSGERTILEGFSDQVTIKAMGEGFSWDTRDLQRDWDAAQRAWQCACEIIEAGAHDLVVLDEINIVLRSGLLAPQTVVDKILMRPQMMHIVATGRNADPLLLEQADTVTEMMNHKHHFRSGVIAQESIEF